MRDPAQAVGGGEREGVPEGGGGAGLAGAQADAEERGVQAEDLGQGGQRRIAREVAEEGDDQPGAQSVLALGGGERVGDAGEDDLGGHPAGGVRLEVEEDLGVPHPAAGGAAQVGAGEVGEVLLGAQHRHVGVVQVEEVLQPGEVSRERRSATSAYGSRTRLRSARA